MVGAAAGGGGKKRATRSAKSLDFFEIYILSHFIVVGGGLFLFWLRPVGAIILRSVGAGLRMLLEALWAVGIKVGGRILHVAELLAYMPGGAYNGEQEIKKEAVQHHEYDNEE